MRFYRDLVGLPVIDSFSESYGEDGTIFGLPNTLTHMEIVRSDHPDASADRFDQIVLYVEDATAVATAVKPLLDAGLAPVANPHPYWVANRGMVFLDPDGRGIVYAPWVFGQQPDPADGFPRTTACN